MRSNDPKRSDNQQTQHGLSSDKWPKPPTTPVPEIATVQALDSFARYLAAEYRLEVSGSGLLIFSHQGKFVRYSKNDNQEERRSYEPIFLRCDCAPGAAELLPIKLRRLAKDLKRLDEIFANFSKWSKQSQPSSNFMALPSDGSIYVQVNPLLETPQVARDYFSTEPRRRMLEAALLVAGSALGVDGIRRFDSNLPSILKVALLCCTGPKMLEEFSRSVIHSLSDQIPELAIDNSEQHFQAFRERVAQQLLS